jgi:hypothetical protein
MSHYPKEEIIAISDALHKRMEALLAEFDIVDATRPSNVFVDALNLRLKLADLVAILQEVKKLT